MERRIDDTAVAFSADGPGDFEKPGQDDVIDKVHADLAARGLDISRHMVELEMERQFEEAMKQLAEEEAAGGE